MFPSPVVPRSVPPVGADSTTNPAVALVEIATRSGRVEVWARPIDRPEVLEGDASVDASGRVIGRGSGRVKLACPEGADVIVGTTSGRVECHGRLGRVAVTNTSGRVTIEHAREVEVRTASGRLTIGRCEGMARVVAASGTVQVEEAGALDATTTSGRLVVDGVGDATVRVGSGRVELGLTRAGTVDVRAQSGRVSITVPPGVHPALQLTTRSGRVDCDLEPGGDGSITVDAGSGRVQVRHA